MEPRDFVYWLNGFFELTGAQELNEAQTKMVKEHLALVLTKTTPEFTSSVYPGWKPLPPDKWFDKPLCLSVVNDLDTKVLCVVKPEPSC
jgi:hypothetical protein